MPIHTTTNRKVDTSNKLINEKMKIIKILLMFMFLIGLSSLVNAALTDSLVDYYSFDSFNTSTVWGALNYNNLTITNQNLNQTGLVGKSIKFNNGNRLPTGKNYTLMEANRVTINVWYSSFDIGSYEGLISDTNDDSADFYSAYEGTTTNDRFDWQIANSATEASKKVSNTTGWHMFTGTFNGSLEMLYLDGVSVTNISTSEVISFTTSLDLGDDRRRGYYYQGYMDELGIWNRSLTSAEVTSLYNSGSGLGYPFNIDDCAYSGSGDWNVNISDNCTVDSIVDLGANRLILSGGGLSPSVSDSLCYQETANISTSCGGLNNGKYSSTSSWTNIQNTFDGDNKTYGNANINGHLYINYTKPSGSLNNSFWQVVDGRDDLFGWDIHNLTIPSDCWNAYSDKLSFDVYNHLNGVSGKREIYWYCYNSSDWYLLRSVTIISSMLYEESMWWNISYYNPVGKFTIARPGGIASTQSWLLNPTSILEQFNVRADYNYFVIERTV